MTPEFVATSKNGPADRMVEFGRGRFIFREGDLGTEMFIIHAGQVEILQEGPEGGRKIAVLERGDFFGEMSILEELPRNASARALTDVKLITIDGATFDSMLRRNPEIGVRIMRKLSRRVRAADDMARHALSGEPIEAEKPLEKEPAVVEGQAGGPHLRHLETDARLGLSMTGTTTIGRRDPVTGIQPEIDLTAVDPERSSSRRHAKIYREGERFFLVEDIGATNGTFLNDSRVRTGIPVEIVPGNTVRFGLVELKFLVD